jgi:asparagine synthase (glutamine-hydrolysing)
VEVLKGDYLMSGIAGVLQPEQVNTVQTILDSIRHRGTSQIKMWEGGRSALGAIGLESLNEQPGPFATPSGSRAIVWDGHLLNRQPILEGLNLHSLSTESDAEIVLHAYEERGAPLFGRLEGEFALAIVDGDRLILARDRLGVKPLYYGFSGPGFYFSSEIKGLVKIVDQVHEFPPGSYLDSVYGLYYYQPYFPEPVQIEGALDSAEQLAVYLRQAVQNVIPEGVEVGVWLSGGVDSSVLAALARPFVDKLYTFSAGVEGAPDLEYARMVAEHIGSEHHERKYGLEELQSNLERTICSLESFDAPLVRSTVSNMLVSELASNYTPWVLSGEGGDELFAGYAYQKAYQGEVELTLSIQEAIASLHNTALQRVDRSASAFGTNAAVPFLDPGVVRYALAIPARWMIRGKQPIDKWPLRQGLATTLPEEVIWRGKSKFWQGSGTGEMLKALSENLVSDNEFNSYRDISNELKLKSKEDYLYYRIFQRNFGDKVPLSEIGRTQHI